ncbi:hypothetical protein A2U01_0060221, partial [Trifolium medium]|nr:hypothetical protein [Trifolium medium]
MVADVPFIHLVVEAKDCHQEVVATLFNQTWLIKQSMRAQEELIAVSFSVEETVDSRIQTLENDLKPLLKRKRDFQAGIQNDVTKLLGKRHTLVRL